MEKTNSIQGNNNQVIEMVQEELNTRLMTEQTMINIRERVLFLVNFNLTMIRRDKIQALYTNKNRETSYIIENRNKMKGTKEQETMDSW